MSWLTTTEVVVVGILVLATLAMVWLIIRRRILSRPGGTFECSVRLHTRRANGGWALGVARYADEWLEWYRVFGVGFSPALRLERTRTAIVSQRRPTTEEQQVLFADQRIVTLGQRRGDRPPVEVAMAPEALTGLRSWLEAAPPGTGRYGNVAD